MFTYTHIEQTDMLSINPATVEQSKILKQNFKNVILTVGGWFQQNFHRMGASGKEEKT